MARAYGIAPPVLLRMDPADLTICWWSYCEGRREVAENARNSSEGWGAVAHVLFALLDR